MAWPTRINTVRVHLCSRISSASRSSVVTTISSSGQETRYTMAAGVSADPVTTRTASHELMLDHNTGHAVHDQTLAMPLSGLKAQIAAFTGTTPAPQGTR